MEDLFRGDIWLGDLGSTEGHEQTGRRPLLIVSSNTFNRGKSNLVVVLPLTTRDRGLALHVRLREAKDGLDRDSTVLCDSIRSVSRSRLIRKLGRVSEDALNEVERRLNLLLQLK